MIRTFLAIFILAASALAQTGGVPGQPKPVKADQIAGNDGTTLRAIKTDANGQIIVVAPTGASSNQVQGTTASGSTAVGNPVVVQGADVIGTGPTSNPFLVGGLDTPNGFLRRFCAFPATADRSTSYGAGTCYNPFGLSSGSNLYDRPEAASSANYAAATTLTARNSAGAQLSEKGSRWTVTSNPAAGSVASASIALEAGVKHVVDTVCFSAGSTAAPAATSLQINIRDGATGAGTIIGVFELDITATTGQNVAPQCITNLNLPGTAGTAMTAEFSSLLANLKEAIFITGHNVN